MKKDFERKRVAVNQAIHDKPRKWYWVFVILFFTAMISGGGWFMYQYNQSPQSYPVFANYLNRAQNWVTERKTRLHKDIDKVKKIAAHKQESNPEIHFEFYTALPHMQVKVREMEKEESSGSHHLNPVITAESVVNTQPLKQQAVVAMAPIFNADQLQRALGEEIKQSKYVIQVGVFKTRAAGERYRAAMTKAGFSARLIKTSSVGKEIYRVQLGPFGNKDQARFAQRQLQQKSVNGIVLQLD